MASLTEKTVFRVIIVTLLIGTAYRLFPVFAGQPALAQFFITEDGYLMLTIARNMAIGLGMSVSEGTIPTNGVQPLTTFLFTLPYLLTSGDKTVSLVIVHVIATMISIGGIFSVRALAREILSSQNPAQLWPWLSATLWFVGPLLLLHSMNGLETGLYTVMVTVTLILFARLIATETPASFRDRLLLGAACGVTFLVRNDGAFLVSAIFAVWALHELIERRHSLTKIVMDLVPPGVMSLCLAAPWMIYNYLGFGSIVPISGTAQSHSAGFGQNVEFLPAKLFEYVFPMLPVPSNWETTPVFIVFASILVIAILLSFFIRVWRRGEPIRYVVAAYGLFALAQCIYYGFYFGADWFLSRYLAPIAPLLVIATISVLLDLLRRAFPRRDVQIMSALSLIGILLSVALLGRLLIPGVKDQGHFQVVDWVTKNVPESVWVGAVQTGTVGYWHDRTINLDGKVNPEALEVILQEGSVLNYVLDSNIEYVADWSGVAGWAEVGTIGNKGNSEFSSNFDIVLQDPELNLGVLKRR